MPPLVNISFIPNDVPINLKLQHPPFRATHSYLSVIHAWGGREFEPCLTGVCNLKQIWQVFPAE